MKTVFICSPLRGNVARNLEYARQALRHSLDRCEAAFAPHLLYPQVLDDTNASQRRQGMAAAKHYLLYADIVAVYKDLGISDGMQEEIVLATKLGIVVEHRTLPGFVG